MRLWLVTSGREVAGAVWGRRVASCGHTLETCETRDAICAFGVELVGETGRTLVVLLVGRVAAMAVFDGDGGELAHGGHGGVGSAAARSSIYGQLTQCDGE